MVKNGTIIDTNDMQRDTILMLFEITEDKGTQLKSFISNKKIVRHKKNYLVEILSTNRDRMNRKIPIELLIENCDFSNSDISKSLISKIVNLLAAEDIKLERDDLNDILNQVSIDITRVRQVKRVKIVVGFAFALFSVLLTLKYLLK